MAFSETKTAGSDCRTQVFKGSLYRVHKQLALFFIPLAVVREF